MDKELFLQHYGILGMHWGNKKGMTKITKVSNSKNSDDHELKVKLKGKKLNEMTNAELKSLTQRLQLEKQYKDLTKKAPNPAQKLVSDLLVNSGKQLATAYVSKYMGKGATDLAKMISAKKVQKPFGAKTGFI